MKHMKSPSARRIAVAVGAVITLVAMAAGPADAVAVDFAGRSSSISSWTWGDTRRVQTAHGQDIRIDLESGPGIDAFWYECTKRNIRGSVRSNIYVSSGWRIIGTDFRPNTCFKIAWRGADATGPWTGRIQFMADVV